MHTTALQEALDNLDYGIKNGSCVLMRDEAKALKAYLAELEHKVNDKMGELDALHKGVGVILPVSRTHAEAMAHVAMRYIYGCQDLTLVVPGQVNPITASP